MYSTQTLERVAVMPLRERYEALGRVEERLTTAVCKRMVQLGYVGYMRKGERGDLPDTTHLRRKLGVLGCRSRGKVYFNATVPYEEAVALSRALGMDPVDAGV